MASSLQFLRERTVNDISIRVADMVNYAVSACDKLSAEKKNHVFVMCI